MRPDRTDESGAVLVEFALVVLLLFALIAGAFDYGMAWKQGLAVNEGARSGARIGASTGTGADEDGNHISDQYVLEAMEQTLRSSGLLDDVIRVVIYRADGANGQVPEPCKAGAGGGGACNIIEGDVLRSSWGSGDFNSAGCFTRAVSNGWCPQVRNEGDWFGVWVQYRQDHTFALTGESTLIERHAVMRIEPEGQQ